MYLILSHIFTIAACDVTLQHPSDPKINFGKVLNSIEFDLKTPDDLKYRPFDANKITTYNLFPYMRVSK